MNYKTIFYEKADGTSPAKDFLISLDYDMRTKIYKSDYFARKEQV